MPQFGAVSDLPDDPTGSVEGDGVRNGGRSRCGTRANGCFERAIDHPFKAERRRGLDGAAPIRNL